MNPQPLFGTRVEGRDGVAVMTLSGELDVAAAPSLRENLARVEASGATTIMLDLREVTFIDSSGLKEFLEARSRAKDNGHRLLMSGASPAAQRLFELTETRFLLDEQEPGQHGEPAV
ncbi:MAG TPA: STAS domain-containing protein [Rubrobacter sp.]|nr:STAS domain-containing protein [Rubrobacter sp.]